MNVSSAVKSCHPITTWSTARPRVRLPFNCPPLSLSLSLLLLSSSLTALLPFVCVVFSSPLAGPWLPSVYCQQCLESQFIAQQWQTYLDNISKADCAAALRRLITKPPPINVKDAGLPCDDNTTDDSDSERGEGEVHSFWYASDGGEHGAKLVGSLVGEERRRFWEEKKDFLTVTAVEEERQKKESGGGGSSAGETAAAVVSEAGGAQPQQQEAVK